MLRLVAWVLLSAVACTVAGKSEVEDAFAETITQVSKASGLAPLDNRSARGGDELRIWVFTLAVVNRFIVLRNDPAGVRGELRLWWGVTPAKVRAYYSTEDERRRLSNDNARNRKWIKSRWNCGAHRIQSFLEVCRVSFREQPDWSQLLRQLEQQAVWDLADGGTLKSEVADGIALVVEVRRGGRTRAYSYSNPDRFPGPDARNAERILSLVGNFVHALEAKSSSPNPSIQRGPAQAPAADFRRSAAE